jgi:DNA-binding response OmpR family regulator
MTVLLVDDDRDLVDLLTFALRRAGFRTVVAYDVSTALKQFSHERPSLAVLDVNLGDHNGFDLLKEIRRQSRIPIIMLTARISEDDKVLGLDLGADDYLTKPFSHRELTARIRAHLRRLDDPAPERISERRLLEVGSIRMNVAEHLVLDDGQPLDLSATEYRLLQYLMLNAGTVVPTRTILRQVWGYDTVAGADVVRVTVHRLRRKLEADSNKARRIHTIPGVGVMLKQQPH